MWTVLRRLLTYNNVKTSLRSRRSLLQQNVINNRRFQSSNIGNDEIVVDKVGAVTTIGINRPDKRNCVNVSRARKLSQAILEFEEDDSSRVGVLHGLGGTFCAGYDLEELSKFNSHAEISEEPGQGLLGPTRKMIKKPMVAAVNGYAVAGGMELALMCDLRVMEETAVMGIFNRRFGVPLVDGGTLRLQALIGMSRALDLILTGRAINAKEAHEYGLANRVVACGTALEEAVKLATSLVTFPQDCMLADRTSVYNNAYSAKSYEEAMEFEWDNGIVVVDKESIPGAKKFVSGVGRHGKFSSLTDNKG